MEFELSGNVYAIAVIAVIIFILALIWGMRYFVKNRSIDNLEEKYKGDLSARSKYPEVDAFKYSGTMLGVGIATVMVVILFSFNWTQYNKELFIPEFDMEQEEELEVLPPPTKLPPPPPPPPPPPKIEEVPDEEIEEDESDLFKQPEIEPETEIDAPVEEESPPPPPPPAPDEPKDIFKVVEQMPRFPGCEDQPTKEERDACAQKKLLEYIYENIKYPAIARENGVEGMVVVQFVVDKDGSISDPKVVRDIGAGTGEEALRVVKLMNKENVKWTPGKQRGRPVRVQFNLPVKFALQ